MIRRLDVRTDAEVTTARTATSRQAEWKVLQANPEIGVLAQDTDRQRYYFMRRDGSTYENPSLDDTVAALIEHKQNG